MAIRNNQKDEDIKSSKPEGAPSESSPTGGNNYPGYLKAALRIPASYPLGAARIDKITNEASVLSRPVPGFVVLDYVPTMGVSYDAVSALNRACFSEFNAIRSQISGNRNYEPADHYIYRMAVDDMRNLYNYAKRIYGIIPHYSATNLYRPRGILKAMGLNAEDWIANAAELYQWLLNHVSALSPFPTVPMGNMSNRRTLFNSAVFQDGEIDSTQSYIVNQKYFWSYEVVDQVKGLTPRKFPATFAAFTQLWDEMYAALQQSSDVYTIAADIRRAFGDKVITTLDAPDAGYRAPIAKHDPVLTAIMNAGIIGNANNSDALEDQIPTAFRIYDEDSIIKCTPDLSVAIPTGSSLYTCYGDLNHLNMISSEPGENDIFNATRLKLNTRTSYNNGNMVVGFISIGSEVLIGARVLGFDTNGSYRTFEFSTLMGVNSEYQSAGDGDEYLTTILSELCNFDWHPPIVTAATQFYDGDSTIVTPRNIYEDTQNYIPISQYQLQQIHETSLLYEFGITD